MTLFETLIIVILLVVISHTAVGFITYAFCNDFIILCPKDIWKMSYRRPFVTVLIYTIYTIFAPIFSIVGCVVLIAEKIL